MTSITLNELFNNFNELTEDEKEYFLETARKQMIELRRYQIAGRVKEAEENYATGKSKSGNADELIKDLND